MSSLGISYFPAGNAAEGCGTSVQPAGSGSSSRDKGSGSKFAGFLPFLAVLRFNWVSRVSGFFGISKVMSPACCLCQSECCRQVW